MATPPNLRSRLAQERRLHRLVSVLTLATAGLLSSVGLGLHGWFGCVHGCGAPSIATLPASATEAEAPQHAAFESSKRCELCDLLVQHRFVRVRAPEAANPSPLVVTTHHAETPWRAGPVARWPAPRGPPC